jgi:hypothetical protein
MGSSHLAALRTFSTDSIADNSNTYSRPGIIEWLDSCADIKCVSTPLPVVHAPYLLYRSFCSSLNTQPDESP